MREFGHFLLRMNNFRDFSQSKSFVNAYPFAKFAKFLLRETHLPYRMYVYAIIIRTGLCAVHIFRVRERERDMCPIMISSIYVHTTCMYLLVRPAGLCVQAPAGCVGEGTPFLRKGG